MTPWGQLKPTPHETLFIPWVEISNALAQVSDRNAEWISIDEQQKSTLVVFTMRGCAPCERFKEDLSEFQKHYDVRLVYCDRPGWQKDPLVKEFERATGKKVAQLPTFWMRGTSSYKVGYAADGRSDLFNWIRGVLDTIADGLFGRHNPEFVPAPEMPTQGDLESLGEPKRYDRSEATEDELRDRIREVEDLARRTIQDVQEFKQSGPLGKLKNLSDIKKDVAEAKAIARRAKSDIDRAKSDPIHTLWVAVGLIAGLLKRRFLN